MLSAVAITPRARPVAALHEIDQPRCQGARHVRDVPLATYELKGANRDHYGFYCRKCAPLMLAFVRSNESVGRRF